jgi:tRNA threonylcarbamoyladenosine modification (KEOPS) complex Cgi121 subunit
VAVNITLSIRLGPLVSLKVNGASCHDIAKALEGHEQLNEQVNAMCSNLAERVYPEGFDLNALREEVDEEEESEEREEQEEHEEHEEHHEHERSKREKGEGRR